MPRYMFTLRYSADAIKALVEKPSDRAKAAKSFIESIGGKMESLYFTLGEDDVVVIYEAPNTIAAAAMSMVVGASGAFSSGRTTELLTPDEAMQAMKKAGAVRAKYKPPTG